jgi:hypothetical protein
MTYKSLYTLTNAHERPPTNPPENSDPNLGPDPNPNQGRAGFLFRSSLGFLPFDEEQKNAVYKENAPCIFTALLLHFYCTWKMHPAFSLHF